MGILDLVVRPSELIALIRLKKKVTEWQKRAASQERDADWEFCFQMLNKVSRSFAIVIEQLGDELRNAICIFYLVLRGLDTVGRIEYSVSLMYSQLIDLFFPEDDMAIDKETKATLLLNFHKSIEMPGFTLSCESTNFCSSLFVC
jgi:farnesyl-diphosphate farnesyltransferase